MARPVISIDVAIEKINKTHNGAISILEYKSTAKIGKFLCNICGHIWETGAGKVIYKTGCPNCFRLRDRYNISYIKEQIESLGFSLLSDLYENSKTKLKIKFDCGHISEITWNDFQNGRRCVTCGIRLRSEKHKTKKEDIIEFLKDNGFEFIEFVGEYKKQRETFVKYSCALGHITTRAVMNIYKYKTCKTCEFIDLAEENSGSSNHFWKGGVTKIVPLAMNSIKEWKKESMKNCNYKCVVTGKDFDDIHHLYSLNFIIRDCLNNLGIVPDDLKYNEDLILKVVEEIKRIHSLHPLGVCIKRNVHKLFHNIYGIGNNTPEQWYDFIEKINNKEIIIEKEEVVV